MEKYMFHIILGALAAFFLYQWRKDEQILQQVKDGKIKPEDINVG